MQLPWLILFSLIFIGIIMTRTQPSTFYTAHASVEFDLLENANFAWAGLVPFESGRFGFKTLFDVNTIADFWSWTTMGLVPLLFLESWDVNEVRNNILSACQPASD